MNQSVSCCDDGVAAWLWARPNPVPRDRSFAPVPRHTGTHAIIRFCSAGFACAVMADKRTTLIVGAHALIRFCLCRTAVVCGCSDPSLRARAGPRPGPGAGVTVSVAPSHRSHGRWEVFLQHKNPEHHAAVHYEGIRDRNS